METIVDWLLGLGLERYAQTFADNDIDLSVLRHLTERDLEVLGVSMGHRKRLAHALGTDRTVDRRKRDREAPRRAVLAQPMDAAERRQVTVVFCDLVNSTGVAARMDPESWRDILQRYERMCSRAIADFDGYVYQLLGDGVVAFFGYPTALEDAPVRAIHASLRILELLSELEPLDDGPLKVRIGISTGLAVVDDVRSRRRNAAGHTLNLAARLQGIAETGQIVVGDATRRLAGATFEYADLGEVRLKGIAHPEHVWRVVGHGHAEGRFDAATNRVFSALVGRDAELDLLLERWASACQGQGRAVFLSGEPGVGKSRVLHALRERLHIDASNVIYCQAAPFFTNSAFYPIIECLDRSLGDTRAEPAAAKRDRLETMLVDRFERPSRDVQLIASLYSLTAPQGGALSELAPQRQREETMRALVDMVAAFALQRPTLMVLEDIHWADPSTLQTLDLLIRRLPAIRLLLVVTQRPEFVQRWTAPEHVETLVVQRLNRADCVKLAIGLGAEVLPKELIDTIVDKTDGVPLYVEELTRTILEAKVALGEGPGAPDPGSDVTVSVPATLRDSLMERLDRLADDKELAQVGAVIGREFTFEMLQAVVDWPHAELQEALVRLIHSGLVQRRGGEAQVVYAFKHALVQEAAYESLLFSARQQLHQRIARTLEARFDETARLRPELLAHHYGEAGQFDKALPFRYQAAKNAAAGSANVEAINHLQTGLQQLRTLEHGVARDAVELSFQTLLGNALMAVKGYGSPGVGSTFGRALALCALLGDTPQLFPVLRGLWMYYLVRSELATATKLSEQLLQLAGRSDDAAAWLEAHRAMGMTCFFRGRFAQARHHLESALLVHDPARHRDHAVLYGTDPVAACNCYMAATLWILGEPDQALVRLRAGLGAAEASEHGFSRSFALFFAAMLHQFRRESDEAHRQADRDIAFSRAGGYVLWLSMALIVRGWTEVADGRHDEGLADMQEGLQAYRATGARLAYTYISSMLAEAWQRCGRGDDAAAVLLDAHQVRSASGEGVFASELFRIRGELSLQSITRDGAGRVDAVATQRRGSALRTAEASFLRALRIARTQEARGFELRAAIGLFRLKRACGRSKEARDALASAYASFTEGLDTPDLQEARRLLDVHDA